MKLGSIRCLQTEDYCPGKSGAVRPFSGRTGRGRHCFCFLYQQRRSRWLPLSFHQTYAGAGAERGRRWCPYWGLHPPTPVLNQKHLRSKVSFLSGLW